MAVAYSAASQPGLLSQQYPPPLLPKPGKDNIRLQKLLKRTAKKKASAQASQSVAPFRSSLSPVNEASPDLEHSDHSTPPQTPSTFYNVQQPPRYSIRPLYQHVASPYPQRAAYGRGASFSPQTVTMPSYSQHVTTVTSYSAPAHISGVLPTQGTVVQPVVPKISVSVSTVPETNVPTALTKQALSTFVENHGGLKPSVNPVSSVPTPFPAPGGQAVIRPLTVLNSFVKPKSPRPTFKATEPSRSPKPLFDVPQIRMYTATTSYYEISRTPPVYDTAGLTSIGITISQNKIPMEIKQDPTLINDIRKGTTQLAQSTMLGTDAQHKTPDIKRATPTPEVKRATPTPEVKRATPTPEVKRATPTPEVKRATPTPSVKRTTPTPEVKRITPTPEKRVKTPTYEVQTSRTLAGRPKTPAYHVSRATTPVFEISKPNPLLFSVSPITIDPERSKTNSETVPNGDIILDLPPTAKVIQQQNIKKAKSEPDIVRGKVPGLEAVFERPKTQKLDPATPEKTSLGYQRPMTPTFEATRLLTTSPGYKRPKTPTSVSPVAFQRPKMPTHVASKPKSGYRGLTPAEYAAFGGIKTYTPAFGISSLNTLAQEEVAVSIEESVECKAFSQEPSLVSPSTAEVFEAQQTSKDVKDDIASITSSIPIIVVSQASDISGASLTQENAMPFSQDAVKQEKTVEEPQKVDIKTPENQKVETPLQEAPQLDKLTCETKQTPPQDSEQDTLNAVRKLLGKGKPQTAQQSAGTEIKVDASIKESQKETNAKDLKPCSEVTALPVKASMAEPANHKEKDAPEKNDSQPTADPVLKVLQKPKELRTKTSGWSRLKKHMVVEQEEPKFPDSETGSAKVALEQEEGKVKKGDDNVVNKTDTQDESKTKDTPKATKMWDAVLFQMFSTKENIMYQIELNKSEDEKNEEIKDEMKEIPSFAYRLPVLLFSPKFDAKKLREAASRPVTKISTVFEMGLIGRKGKEEEPKDFNRTARGFTAS